MAIVLNCIIIVLEILGLRISIKRKWALFAFYTQLSNMVTLVSSIAFLIMGPGAAGIRYLSTCMLTMTFLVTAFVLVPMGGGLKKLMFSGNGLYHHTLCPIISIGSYIFFETHSDIWLLPVVLTFIYGMIMLYLNYKKIYDGPYPFFRVYHQSRLVSVLWFLTLTVLITLLSLAVLKIAPKLSIFV